MKRKKVCYAASSGGHVEELLQLKPLITEQDIVLTEKSLYSIGDCCAKIIYVSQINRNEFFFIPKFLKLFFQSLLIILNEKPEIIVSTGALATFPICFLGKVFGRKIVYIESFARVDKASMTGKLMYNIADLFIVQWEEMLKIFPRATYGGGIF